MSIDKSLVTKGKLVRHRNVLTRPERIKFLADEGLPKVKTIKVKKKAKAAKKTEESAEAADDEKEKGKAS